MEHKEVADALVATATKNIYNKAETLELNPKAVVLIVEYEPPDMYGFHFQAIGAQGNKSYVKDKVVINGKMAVEQIREIANTLEARVNAGNKQ